MGLYDIKNLPRFIINLNNTLMKKLPILIVIIFFTTKLLAQETVIKDDMTIHTMIGLSSNATATNFMDINKIGSKANIVYKNFNRIDYDQVKKDTAYINLNIDPNHIDLEKFKGLGPIHDRHTIYDTTKVTVDLKTDTVYNKILLSLAKRTKEELEKSIIGEHITLDGFGFGCTIITNSGTKTISMRSPPAETYPIVSSFLEESYDRLWPNRKKIK